jgi:iron complex outermembrane receptor protein
MKFSCSVFLFWLIGITTCVFGQTDNSSSVKGKVIDLEGNQPVPLVQVVLDKYGRGTSTDMEGNFVFNNLPQGSYELRVVAIGYQEYVTTFSLEAGQQLLLDTISISTDVLMMKEVTVTSSVIALGDERQTPTATSSINARDIQEQMGSTEFPEVLKSMPGIYTSMAGGSLGAGRVTVRGFGSENTAVMINGIPVNDMENGRVYWSNWGGLNDVTRMKQVQRGLGNSKLALSSIGGTINILSKPTDMRKGVIGSYAITNSSYRHRLMLTASTGLMKTWAVTFSGSRRWGDGYRPGTFTDSWAYYLSVYKKLGKRHQFLFTGFGAPQKTGGGYNAFQSEYEKYGYLYNKAWGYHEGEVKNRSVNQFHKPQLMLSHYFDVSKKTQLTTNAYVSIGRGGSTNIQRSLGSASLNSGYFYDDNGQFVWDTLYAINRANVVTSQTHLGSITGARSKYYLEKRNNHHNWYGILSSLKTDVTQRLSFSGGVDGRLYHGKHFATVEDLLGGSYMIDQDQFKGNADHNALVPNYAATVGDIVRYNYNSSINWLGVFGQGEYRLGPLDFFLTANYSRTSYYREGLFQATAYDDAGIGGYGKSKNLVFFNHTIKGGVNYRITGRHNVFVNAGYFNRAPFFVNAFVNPTMSNQIMDDLKNEQIKSVEGGYSFRSGKVIANLNVYYTKRENFMNTESYLSLVDGVFVDVLTSDVGAIHKGIELDVKVKPIRSLELNGMLSLGDWTWSDNAKATLRNNNTLVEFRQQEVYVKGLPIGNAAQTVAALRARYQLPFFAYVGLGWNYFDRLYMDYSPAFRVDPNNTAPLKLNSFYTFDFFAGKSVRFKKSGDMLRFTFNINNLLNKMFLVEGNENPSTTPYYQTNRPRIFYFSVSYEM